MYTIRTGSKRKNSHFGRKQEEHVAIQTIEAPKKNIETHCQEQNNENIPSTSDNVSNISGCSKSIVCIVRKENVFITNFYNLNTYLK